MSKIKLGCEAFTWQMPGGQSKGKLEHIMEVCAQAGFAGLEPETSFLQPLEDPIRMKDALDRHGLELAVLCGLQDRAHPAETEAEKTRAAQWIDFLAHFPGTTLLLVQMPGKDRKNLHERQQNCIRCVNDFARRAVDRGITCSYHPNSPEGSVFRIESDYEILLHGLDETVSGYCPDVGHIAKGGMDPAAIIRRYRDRVNLVHFKDMYADGSWAHTSAGVIDFQSITQELVATGYEGWIIMEDECDEAITDPDGLTLRDGEFIRQVIVPMIE